MSFHKQINDPSEGFTGNPTSYAVVLGVEALYSVIHSTYT